MSADQVGGQQGENTFKKSHLLPSSSQISLLHDTLHSIWLPPNSVLSMFQSVVDQSALELERYDIEIERLEETLARVKSDRSLLKSYSNGCRTVFSPIRRLPTELLIEVFDLCCPPGQHILSSSTSKTEELEEHDRIAKSYLLQLSQVCSRWHGIAMGTPRLWSSIACDSWAWDYSLNYWKNLLGLIESSFERSGECPLNLQIAVLPRHPAEQHIIKLIARYSRRWKNVCLWLDPREMKHLLSAKGHFPLLENLTINCAESVGSQHAIDVFSVAPRLKTVACKGWSTVPVLPWGQLLRVKFDSGLFNEIPLDGLPLLAAHTCCELNIEVNRLLMKAIKKSTSITSKISTLLFSITYTYYIDHSLKRSSRKVLATVFDCLTLPRLTSLRFIQQPNNPPPLWNQTCFLHFISRSMLGTTLAELEVYAIIEDKELLECLLHLPFLENLRLWDCEDGELEGDHGVITDTLLTQLAHDINIVPRLGHLVLMSTIDFIDDYLWKLVTSRIHLRHSRSENEPFVMMVSYLPRRQGELSPQFLARLSELEKSGDLVFSSKCMTV
ncbi:hypothetical protein C8R45DRAFT_1100296 [Mycena sanguinolenta]|nr:hypothetical protein C8R45DRAFT_1100296 [Mycena sanguinolenta]